MERWAQNTIAIQTKEKSLETIEKQARLAAKNYHRHVYLISWWNRANNAGGPAEAVLDSLPKSVREYAESRGADLQVSVNRDEYVFYYSSSREPHPGGIM